MPAFYLREAIHQLLDAYTPSLQIPPRIIRGRYLGHLSLARDEVANKLTSTFGVSIPESVTRSDYTLNDLEDAENERLLIEAARLHPDRYKWKDAGSARSRPDTRSMREMAAGIRRKVYREMMNIEDARPSMRLTEPLHTAPTLRSANGNYRRLWIGCMVSAFTMNAYALAEAVPEPPPHEDIEELYKEIRYHPNTAPQGVYDLGWMLGMLCTETASELFNKQCSAITTVGADFAELSERVLRPIRRKRPDVSFVMSAAIGSENSISATHAVTVNTATDVEVSYNDPLYDTPCSSPSAVFWNRWAEAALQTHILISAPY